MFNFQEFLEMQKPISPPHRLYLEEQIGQKEIGYKDQKGYEQPLSPIVQASKLRYFISRPF